MFCSFHLKQGNSRTERHFVVTGKILVSLLLLSCNVLLMYKQYLNSLQEFPIKSKGRGRLHLSSVFKARKVRERVILYLDFQTKKGKMELVKWYLQSMFWINGMLRIQALSLTKIKDHWLLL